MVLGDFHMLNIYSKGNSQLSIVTLSNIVSCIAIKEFWKTGMESFRYVFSLKAFC